MAILRIEHPVLDFEAWKKAFDADPVGREKSGVRRYQVLRASDDPNFVMIDLAFDRPQEAQAMLTALRALWDRVGGTIISDPHARIVEPVETKEF